MKKLVSFIVSVVMLVSCLGSGICVFATEDNPWQTMFADYYYGTTEYAGGKIYPLSGVNFYYDGPPATVTTLFDKSLTATADTPVVLYTVNTNTERIGTDSDETIITDLLERDCIVLVVDYHNDSRAAVPTLDWSLQQIRLEAKNGSKYINFAGMFASTASPSAHTYILPAGYNISFGETYWTIDEHSSEGTLERIVEIWNTDFVGVWGNKEITLPDGTTTTVEAYTETGVAGVGETGVDTIFECLAPDGGLIDMELKMDIIYPTNPANEVPVMALASSSEDRRNAWESKSRPQLTGFLFSGYAGVLYDYGYVPMARTDHYNYFDGDSSTGHVTGDNKTYSVAVYNHSKSDPAAMRKIRYLADAEPNKYKFDKGAIGVFGNSKSGLVTRLGHQNPEDLTEWRFLPGHHGESRYDAGKTTDQSQELAFGETAVTHTIRGGKAQPWLTYRDGSEIPSNANFVYANCGGGAETITEGNAPMYVTGTMGANGSYYNFAPQVMSGCYQNNVPVMYYANPGVGHSFGCGLDRDYGQDVYYGFLKTAEYYLHDAAVAVAYIEPAQDTLEVNPKDKITVKFFGQVDETEIQKVTVTGSDNSVVDGTWKASYGNTTWEFYPQNMKGGMEYTVTVPNTLTGQNGKVMASTVTQSFTTRPDDGVAAETTQTNDGTTSIGWTSETDANGMYLLFDSDAMDVTAKSGLRFYVSNDAANVAEVYALESINKDNLTNSVKGEKLGEVTLSGMGEYEVDISDYMTANKDADAVGFLISAKKKTETVVINDYNFEDAEIGTKTVPNATVDGWTVGSVQNLAQGEDTDNQALMVTNYSDNPSASYPNRLTWVGHPAKIITFSKALKDSVITEEDYGRLFRVEMDVYDEQSGGRQVIINIGSNALTESSGTDNVDLKQKRKTYQTAEDQWTTISLDCRIDHPLYWSLLQKQSLVIQADTTGTECANNPATPLYIDNVKVVEEITDIELAGVSLTLYSEVMNESAPDSAGYVQSGSKADTAFDGDTLTVSASNISMSGENKKTYARIPVSAFDESKRAGVSVTVTEGGGQVSVYGMTDINEAADWNANTINYINAYANDRFSHSVDLDKVYGSKPLDTLAVGGSGTYTFDITEYMAYMKEKGAEYATVIFVSDSTAEGQIYTEAFDNLTSWSKNSYAAYNSTTRMGFVGMDSEMQSGSTIGGYGVMLDSSVNHGSGSGKSLYFKPNKNYCVAKLNGVFGTFEASDVGKVYRVTFWAKSDTDGVQLDISLNSAGKSTNWQTKEKSYQAVQTETLSTDWKRVSYDVLVTEDMLASKYTATSSLTQDQQVPGQVGINPLQANAVVWIDDIEVTDISGDIAFAVSETGTEVNTLNYKYTRNFDDLTSLQKLNNAAYNSTTNVLAYVGCSPDMQKTMKLDAANNHGEGTGNSLTMQPDASWCRAKFPGLLGTLTADNVGDTYTVSFWAKTDVANATINLELLAGTGTYNSKSYITAIPASFGAANTWKQFDFSFTVDKGMLAFTNDNEVPAMPAIVTSGLSSGNLWIDDIEVTAVTHKESGLSLGADQAAAICGVKFDGTTGVSRASAAAAEGIRKTYFKFGEADLNNLNSATLELDVASALGQTLRVYGIIGKTYPTAPLIWNNAPANADGTGMKESHVFGGEPLEELTAQSGTLKVDVTDYLTSAHGGDSICAITTETGGGQEFINLDLEAFALADGLDYTSDSTISFADGVANVAGQKLQLNNIFGNGNVTLTAGQSYTITADVTGDAISLAVADVDGGNTKTLTADTSGVYTYTATAEDADNGLCALVFETTGTTGFTVDNVNVSSHSPVTFSNARLITANAVNAVPALKITGVQAQKVENNYNVTVQFSMEATGLVVVALYDKNDVLVGISSEPIANDNMAEVQLPYLETAESAKAFLWDGLNAIEPICKAKAANL